MRKYLCAVGSDEVNCPIQQSTSQIRGINGAVSTQGVRRLEVGFALEADAGIAVGTIDSVELTNSDAPLLISIRDQRRLRLTMELHDEGRDRIYRLLGNSHHEWFGLLEVVAFACCFVGKL